MQNDQHTLSAFLTVNRTQGDRLRSGLYKIIDEHGRLIPFRINDVQETMLREIWYWNIILKGRQHGISTLICLMMLDQALFRANTQCGLVDATLTDAEKKLNR